jgi:hypothetical protein
LTRCPFCGTAVRGLAGRAFQAFASGATMVVLAACYGPPGDKGDTACLDTGDASCDIDGDGFSKTEGDCDDANAEISPAATEVCDDEIDNDCDELTDTADTEECPGG